MKRVLLLLLLLLLLLVSRFSHLRLCATPIDGCPLGYPIPGILQARTLEWVAISFSNAWKWKVKVKSLSRVWLFATPWTAAYRAPPSMGFSRQEYWSGVPLPSLYQHVRCVQLCGSSNILWHSLSLGLEGKLTFSSPVATTEFSKFAGILSAALSQHHFLGFEIAQLEFRHLH